MVHQILSQMALLASEVPPSGLLPVPMVNTAASELNFNLSGQQRTTDDFIFNARLQAGTVRYDYGTRVDDTLGTRTGIPTGSGLIMDRLMCGGNTNLIGAANGRFSSTGNNCPTVSSPAILNNTDPVLLSYGGNPDVFEGPCTANWGGGFTFITKLVGPFTNSTSNQTFLSIFGTGANPNRVLWRIRLFQNTGAVSLQLREGNDGGLITLAEGTNDYSTADEILCLAYTTGAPGTNVTLTMEVDALFGVTQTSETVSSIGNNINMGNIISTNSTIRLAPVAGSAAITPLSGSMYCFHYIISELNASERAQLKLDAVAPFF